MPKTRDEWIRYIVGILVAAVCALGGWITHSFAERLSSVENDHVNMKIADAVLSKTLDGIDRQLGEIKDLLKAKK